MTADRLGTREGDAATERSFMIAVPTYRRPEGLRQLLTSFDHLEWPPTWRFDGVLIVDNDPDRSAQPVVEEMRARVPWPLRYSTETVPGVVAARNRALREADGVSHLAMVDDDEVVKPGWPKGLLETAARTSADLVCGEVIPLPERSVPAWMLRPSFLGRTPHPDGAVINRVNCGNLLIARRLLETIDPLFDERFGRTGGEDSFLSAMVRAKGGELRWSATAPTMEVLPPDRCSLTWLRQRWRRNGAIMTLVPLALATSPQRRAYLRARALVLGVVRFLYGTLAPAAPGGRTDEGRADALRQRMQGLGQIGAAFGHRHTAYGPGGSESP